MNYLKLHLFTTLLIASVGHAQVSSGDLNAEVDSEIDKMYSPAQTSSSNGQIITQTIVVPKAAVQKQPVTVVEASPLSNSNAESIRKNRQDEEMRTESRIVEKLELSRMEDEKKRAAVLFGDKFDTLNKKQQVMQDEQPAAVIVAPSSNVQAQPIVIQQKEGLTKDDIHQEVRAALDEDKATKDDSTGYFDKKYISVVTALPQYTKTEAVSGKYTLGVGLGAINKNLIVEGGFLYSTYSLSALYPLVDMYGNNTGYNGYGNFLMNQYQGYVSAKFQLMSGSIKPSIGGITAYSYRTYTSDSYTSYGPAGTKFGTSNSIDLGITTAIDIMLSESLAIGADLKYMFNVSASMNGNTSPGADSPEKLNYYLLGVAAKMSF